MKIVLRESQLIGLVESDLQYGDEQLPLLIDEIKKDIIESTKVCVKFLSMLTSLNIGDAIENPSQYMDYVNNMKKVHTVFYNKSNRFYKILNTYENDFDNQILQEFDKLNSKMDTVQNDMDTIIGNYSDILETVLEIDGSVTNTYQYLTKVYGPNMIKVK